MQRLGTHLVWAIVCVIAASFAYQFAKKQAPGQSLLSVTTPLASNVASTPTPISLTGQIFIVTRGRENVRLGRVHVYAFKRTDALTWIQQNKQSYESQLLAMKREIQENEERSNRLRYYIEAEAIEIGRLRGRNDALQLLIYHYDEQIWSRMTTDLTALAHSSTDADGRFEISIPTDVSIVLFAHSSRTVGDETEYYSWLISRWDGARADMSNDNMTGSFQAFTVSAL